MQPKHSADVPPSICRHHLAILNHMLCAICKKPVDMSKENRFRPFCSERCQLVDLGTWASGGYEPDPDDDTQDHEHPDDLKKRRTLH